MRSGRFLVGLVLLAVGALIPLSADGSLRTGSIPPGTDTFDSTAHVDVTFNGLGDQSLTLTGPVVVQRGAQTGDTIPTEMLSMDLTGQSQLGGQPVQVKLQAGRNFGGQPVQGMLENVVVAKNGTLVGADSSFRFTQFFMSFFGSQKGQELHFDFTVDPPLEPTARITSLPPNVPVLTPPVLGSVDHFKCYAVKAGKGFKPANVKLADQFESERATLVKPLTLCAPVRKNGSLVRKPLAHLKCYAISSTSAKPKEPEVTVTVENQFGTVDLVVLQPRSLCVPTLKKRLQQPVPKPVPPRGSLAALTDHFKCYDVRPKTPFQARTVLLEDQFEVERTKVIKPIALCAPVAKNGLQISDSVTHLTCYSIQDVSRKVKGSGRLVVVRNQFGVEVLTVLQPQSLCVPSLKKPPCSEYAERAKAALIANGQQVGTINQAIHIPFEGAKGSPCG